MISGEIFALAAKVCAVAGIVSIAYAIVWERRMQKHRRPGIGYWQVTLRRDGGWRREEFFKPEGLRHQRLASRFGLTAAVLWLLGLVLWMVAAWYGAI